MTNPADRFSAEAACAHAWLGTEDLAAEAGEDCVMQRKSSSSALKRDSSNISIVGLGDKAKDTEMKRSYFVWDLAGAGTSPDSSEELLPGS